MSTELDKCIGDNIRNIRTKKGISQKEISNALNSSQAKISKIEKGVKSIVVDDIIALCQIFNVSADYLLGLTDTPSPDLPEDDHMLLDLVENYNQLNKNNKYRLLAESVNLLDSQSAGYTDKRKNEKNTLKNPEVNKTA